MEFMDNDGAERITHQHMDWSDLFGFAMMALSGRTEDLAVMETEAEDIATSAGLIADAAVAEVVRRKGWQA